MGFLFYFCVYHMNQPFSYHTDFLLDKEHFQECYSESVVADYSYRAYFKAILLSLSGILFVLFSDMNKYAAWFVFSLGVLEALSVHYQKPWWVMRQMLSKAAKSKVELTIDEQGINSASFYAKLELTWSDIISLKKTNLGWVITHAKGRNYISNRCLSEGTLEFLATKVTVDIE